MKKIKENKKFNLIKIIGLLLFTCGIFMVVYNYSTKVKLDENNDHQLLSIYTNYLDSGFDSEVNDYITPNPTEQEIIDFLKVIDIDCSEFEQKLEELDR